MKWKFFIRHRANKTNWVRMELNPTRHKIYLVRKAHQLSWKFSFYFYKIWLFFYFDYICKCEFFPMIWNTLFYWVKSDIFGALQWEELKEWKHKVKSKTWVCLPFTFHFFFFASQNMYPKGTCVLKNKIMIKS